MNRKKSRFKVIKILRGWFISGLIILSPILLTVYIISWVLSFVDNIFWGMLPIDSHFIHVIKSIPGIGLVIVLLIIIFVGMFGRTFIVRSLFTLLKSMFEFTPFVKSVFKAINSTVGSIFSDSGKSFKEVVLLEYPNSGNFVYGFVTNSLTEGEIYEKINSKTPTKEVLHIFVPTTPIPTSGFIIITGVEKVQRLNIPVAIAMRNVISGGVAIAHEHEIKPEDKPKN